MCVKHQRRCATLLDLREEALNEWTGAETYEEVCRAWGRLGGRVTLHRYGRGWFSALALRRWDKLTAEDLAHARVGSHGFEVKDD